jgi:CRP-like cAMP-binding protein
VIQNVTHQDMQGLRRCYLFAGLEEAQFHEVLEHASTVELPQGHILFNQGDAAHAFYWVAEGVIRLYRASSQGDEKVIELAGPNRLFAEAVLFMGGQFPVNAAAQVPSRLLHKLSDQGCIELDGHALYIKDAARLIQGGMD